MLVMYCRASLMFFAAGMVFGDGGSLSNAAERDFSPQPSERQLPYSMHSAMEELPRITVGQKDADLIGTDHRVLQAAVDYMGALGGGTVEVGEGEFLMRDSLHLRSNVVVRGQGDKTILRKAACSVSPLALDGDFGEEQITVREALRDSVSATASPCGTIVAREVFIRPSLASPGGPAIRSPSTDH